MLGEDLGHEGTVASWVTNSTRSENFVAFLFDLVDQAPGGLDLLHLRQPLRPQTPLVAEFLTVNPQVHLHFTPTHAS